MPLEPVAVYEDCASLGYRIVVVDEEGEISYGLMATIGGHAKVFDSVIFRRIDLVDAEVILGRETFEPGSVTISSDMGNYQSWR